MDKKIKSIKKTVDKKMTSLLKEDKRHDRVIAKAKKTMKRGC